MADEPRRWTAESLEQECRNVLLRRARLKLGELPRKLAADVQWSENGIARVRVDGHKVGVRSGTIHELLHVVLDDSLSGFDDELCEVIILAFEGYLDGRIAGSKRRAAWWRRSIEGVAR